MARLGFTGTILKATIRCGKRGLHTTQCLRIDPKTVEEVRIPVPWGHIAGKWWGARGRTPIVAVHGWQDNAGSWDPFLELMPDKYSVLALDLPGNGLSSHYPPFMSYTFSETPSILKRVINYLNCGKIHLLGHSGGSAACFLYANTFPEDVISYCGIDYLIYCYKKESVRVAMLSKTIDTTIMLAMRDPKKAKRYSWEDAKQKWVIGTAGSVSPMSAEILMQRGVIKHPDGKVAFSRDNRVKAGEANQMRAEQVKALVEDYKLDTCLIRAKQSIFFYDRGIRNYPEILETLAKQCKLYEYHEIDGNHHLHMDNPKDCVDIYLSFLDKVCSKSSVD